MSEIKCPWLGFKPYGEEDAPFFNGRSKAIKDLLDIVESKTITVCYAESGTGKTSLINAGIVPNLREKRFLPIWIRFDIKAFEGKTKEEIREILCHHIISVLCETKKGFEEKNRPYKLIWDLPDEKQKVKLIDLWKALRSTPKVAVSFNDFEYHNVYKPFLILDQFEQMLYDSNSQLVIESFFELLKSLVLNDTFSDEYLQMKEKGLVKDSEDLFKVLVSLRQEYIGVLDYWCMARVPMPSLHDNRFSLQPLTTQEARTVILPKGYEIFENAIDQIIEIAKENNSVSSILLSVVCRRLFEQAPLEGDKKKQVTDVEVEKKKETIIRDYYDEQLKKAQNGNESLLSDKLISQIEDVLVIDDGKNGKRSLLAVKNDLLQGIVFTENIKLLLENNGIIRSDRIGQTTFVELIHDKVAGAVLERKKERRNQKAKEERRKANYQKFISRQNPLTLGGRRIWDNKTFTFSVDNSRSTSLNNSSSRAEILNDLLQQNKNEDRGIEQLFFDKLFRQTVDTGKISLNFNENCSKDGISDFEIETERVRGSQQLKIKSIKFFDSNTESFYTVDGFCGIKSEYDKKTGYEIKREYICEGYTSVGIATVEFGDFKEFVFDDFKGGLPQKVMYYDSKKNLCKHIDGNYGVKIEYDDYGNETCRWFLDKDGKITPIYNGVCGLINIFDKQDRIVKQFFVNQKGNPITDDYGFHGVEFIYNETPNELLISESRYIDVNKCLCNNPQGFCIEQFQYDLKGRIIWQHYLNKDRGEVEKKDGVYFYSKLKIGYNELDRPNNIAMYNLSGSIFKVIRYAYDPKGTIKECSFYEIKRSQNGQIERKSKSQDSHVFKIKYEHDNHGFLICQSHFDDDDVSTQDSNGYSNICFIYGCLGELNEYRFYNNQKSDKYPVRHICYKYADDGTCEITQIENEIKAETKAATRKVLGAIKKNKDEQKVEVKDISIFKGVINHRHEFIKGYLDESNDYLPGTPLTVRRKYDIDGNVVEELLFDKNDKKPICDEDGIYGWHVDYDKRTGLKCQMTYLGESGEIANNKYNYAVVKYSNEEYMGGIYFATSYFDKDCQPTRCELGYHKRLETDSSYNDELCKQTIYLDCQGEPCNSTDGYHKQVFYDEQDNNRRVVSFFNSELLPVINESRGFHKREELLTNEGLIANISFYNEKGNLVNVSGGFAKQTFKRYDSFNTLFYYPFIDHDVIRFYDEQDQKVNVEYKGIVGYKFIEPSNDIALIKVVNSKGRIKYWNKSLLWRCINIVWVPIAIALLLIIYPLYSLLKSLYNLCRSKQAAIPESASIIRIAQIFDDVPSGESFIQAPIRQFDVEEGSWIVQWNHWSYNYSQDTATEFEKEFNNSPTRKIITFYNPKEKAFLDVEITSPNIGLRIQDAQVPKNDVLEMMERWEQFKKNSVEI